jgi:anti-sigma regulatory factor (Ser/Thr protein kinase)
MSETEGGPGRPGAADWSELPDDLTAPGIARSTARRFVSHWGARAVVEPLVLIVSELVANAVRHGRPPIQLMLQRVGRGVRVDVHDEAPASGVMQRFDGPVDLPRAAAQGGRGLPLVHALSAKHGVDNIPDDGKRIWAVVEPGPPSRRASGAGSSEGSPRTRRDNGGESTPPR